MSDVEATAQPAEVNEPQTATEQPATSVEATNEADAASTEGDVKEKQVLKTTAQIDYKNFKNNRKFDPSTQEVTDDPVAIRKQVEFYFGDWNFPQDKFMWESCQGAENKPIPIEKLHTFKRMRRFQPYSAVVAALRDSTFLDVSGEEGKELVNRKVPYKPMSQSKAKSEAATVYVKGFGDETPDTQFDVESFFAKFGEVKGLKLRRTNENLFKGSVFVTFADEETAKAFITKDPAPKWKDHDLKIMSKADYCEEKSELIRQGKLEPNGTVFKKFFEGKDSGTRRGGKDQNAPRDRDDWKKRRENDQKNGFQDRKGGRGGRGGRGRGGRGGRGDRGGRRDGDNRNFKHSSAPHIQSTATEETNGKRGREEDGASAEPPAKKVDAKEEGKSDA